MKLLVVSDLNQGLLVNLLTSLFVFLIPSEILLLDHVLDASILRFAKESLTKGSVGNWIWVNIVEGISNLDFFQIRCSTILSTIFNLDLFLISCYTLLSTIFCFYLF